MITLTMNLNNINYVTASLFGYYYHYRFIVLIMIIRIFWETCVPGNARVSGSGEATAIWSPRHCKPAACILGLTGANMQLSLICGFL